METHLQDLVRLSFSSTPDELLKCALDTCIRLAGATGGSILGEEGPYLQFLFADQPSLIGMRVPLNSIAGDTVNRDRVIYTFAPGDKRHYDGVDRQIQRQTRYLLSIPIPSVHARGNADHARRNMGAVQLLFDRDVLDGQCDGVARREFEPAEFQQDTVFAETFRPVFGTLPLIAFGLEVMKLRQTSYQVIHELKNKLIGGLSWLNCLADDLTASVPTWANATTREDFSLAETAVREGAELAKKYLQLTKVYEPRFEMREVAALVHEVVVSTRALVRDMGAEAIGVGESVDSGITDFRMDVEQMKMALFNLCKNAVEVLRQHGGGAVPAVRLTAAPSDTGGLVLTVSDNGPGMPSEIADNLFIPFKTKKEGGTGLGLTIAKKIVDVHGGTIRCETRHTGTNFRIEVLHEGTP